MTPSDQALKKPYTVVYDREHCIGALACCAVHPDRWLLDDEGKATLRGATQENNNALQKLDIDESELELQKQAAEVCPVRVIWIEKNKKKIYPEE